MELYHCFGHWLCKKLELRSVGLPLSKFGTDQLCWAEICNLKSLLQTALAPWASLSVELIFFSPLLLLSKTVSSRKLCWAHLWYLLPDIKVDRKWSNSLLRTIFSQKCHFQIISHGQWWTKKFHPFFDSTDQECMIFVRIGDGPCNCYYNEVCAGVCCNLWRLHEKKKNQVSTNCLKICSRNCPWIVHEPVLKLSTNCPKIAQKLLTKWLTKLSTIWLQNSSQNCPKVACKIVHKLPTKLCMKLFTKLLTKLSLKLSSVFKIVHKIVHKFVHEIAHEIAHKIVHKLLTKWLTNGL